VLASGSQSGQRRDDAGVTLVQSKAGVRTEDEVRPLGLLHGDGGKLPLEGAQRLEGCIPAILSSWSADAAHYLW
jgi:hypothetical protein